MVTDLHNNHLFTHIRGTLPHTPVEWIFVVPVRWRGTRQVQRVPVSETHCLTCWRTLDSKPRTSAASSS